MKTITNLAYPAFALFALACYALPPQARAQTCQQGCDLTNLNTFLGDDALINNTTGTGNVAIGYQALPNNTDGEINVAIGAQALLFNTSGFGDTAIGQAALYSNTTGNNNTATGGGALFSTTTGILNTAAGDDALFSNTTGNNNTTSGVDSLYSNTTGNDNTATGVDALHNNTAGSNNIALGSSAGVNLTTGSNNIDVGNNGVAGESRTIRIGTTGTQRKTFIAGISGATVASGVGVIVGSNGQLGTVVSSERFKEAIKPMEKASEAILALKPVTFRYKHELDPDAIPQFGLVAEEVERANPDLVARDEHGKPYTVRYEAVNAMLLNEFLKEHRTVQDLRATVASQQKQIEALTAGLQKVSAQLELSKSATQTVSR